MSTAHRKLLWHALAPCWPSMAVATFLTLVLAVTGALIGVLIGPCVQVIVDSGTSTLQFKQLFGSWLAPSMTRLTGYEELSAGLLIRVLPAGLLIVALVKSTAGLVQWFLWERAGEIASRTLRNDLVAAFLRLDPMARRDAAVEPAEAGLSSTITTDIRMLREFIVHYYGGLPRELLQVILLLVTLVALSPKLTLIFVLGVLPAGVAGARISRVLRRRAARALSDYSELTEWLQQRLLGIETIKHYRTEALEAAEMRQLNTRLHERFVRAARARARTSPVMEAVAVLAIAAVLIVALLDVASGASSGAVMLSFFSTLGLISQSAGKLGRYVNSNREGAAALDRISGTLQPLAGAAQERIGVAGGGPAGSAAAGRAAVSLKLAAVTVRYPGVEVPAVSDLSVGFVGGRIYCLAGPSGAGKSTVFNLILGLVRPTSGALEFEAVAAPRGRIAYMPQKVQMLPGTVAENVAYPGLPVVEEEVREALRRVALLEAVEALPQGIHTVVGEGGLGLSGGQAQRVLLARLWYLQAPLVLIDEGTSALDPEVERLVHTLVADLAARGALVITIAHRRAVAEQADEILLLDHGRLAAMGPAREILGGEAWRRLF